jgi:IclR family acetate operon transcriptional repressor
MKQPAGPGPGRTTHQSLERGLRLLEIVASNGAQCSLAETARRTGLHRSTAHHLLQALVGFGYLHQDPQTRGYMLAAKLFQLTGRTWTPEQLGEIAHPIVAELTRQTGEGSSVAIYHDSTVRIVAKRDPAGPVRVVQEIDAHRPVYATAVGKALVAFLPRPALDALLGRLRFERFTARTIATPAAFEADLRRVRATGCAFDDEEHIEGIRCVAAPVVCYTGSVIASLCVVGPRTRLTRRRLRELRPTLLAQARDLSIRLGWSPNETAMALSAAD